MVYIYRSAGLSGGRTLVNASKQKSKGHAGTDDLKEPIKMELMNKNPGKGTGGIGSAAALHEKLSNLNVYEKQAEKRKKAMNKPIAFSINCKSDT